MINKSFLPFLGKFCQKYHNCLIEIKFDIQSNSNILNLMVMFAYSFLNLKYSFWSIFFPKVKFFLNDAWCLYLLIYTKTRYRCVIVLFLTGNIILRQIWSQKMKIVCLRWKLSPKPDQFEYAEFHGDNYSFRSGPQMPFLSKFCPKYQKYLFKKKLGT